MLWLWLRRFHYLPTQFPRSQAIALNCPGEPSTNNSAIKANNATSLLVRASGNISTDNTHANTPSLRQRANSAASQALAATLL